MLSKADNQWTVVSIICLWPLVWLLLDVLSDDLGPNPIQAIHIRLGDWALRFLCITLAVTPIQTVTKWKRMADYRQMFGLYAFFYATLHVLGYLFVDHAAVWQLIGKDMLESSYIWFGVVAYVIILLLAITSPNSVKRRMGKNWKKLHRLIYYSAAAAAIHYFWQLKGNLFQPLFYLTIIALLLGFRLFVFIQNQQVNKLTILNGRKVSLEEGE
ncbi:MAG: sulfite oxidase heme-binding subunit YedZ [Gammaproteobacteria bacterium]